MAKPRKIILAEDNLADVELAKMAFEEVPLPLEMVHLFDGQALLDYLRTDPLDNIALVLMDINMPKVTGLEVLEILYKDEELRKIPVIVFSSSVHEEDVLKAYDYGANAYVNKPIDVQDFIKSIHAIANFWGDINVLPTFNVHV